MLGCKSAGEAAEVVGLDARRHAGTGLPSEHLGDDATGLHKGSSFVARVGDTPKSYAGNVPGASEEARRVKIMNANWIAGADGDDGDFELMIVTSDNRHHVVAPSPAAMTALVALAQADTVLVWDPADRRLIAANLRGAMPWTEDPATPGT